jgi:pimeloyl-ACP methyl ester carboxylesterase
MPTMTALPGIPLPSGIRSRFVENINGLSMHVLEAGFETPARPCVLLLHGFPELAFSWRKVMPELAAAGYHVIAPDQRGYGRTTGWNADYDGDLAPFRVLNLVRDALGLVAAFGHTKVDAVVGHDFGSPVAAWCALLRPDVFRSVVLMSAPFGGPPPLPFDTANRPPSPKSKDPVHRELAALPRPRKHYQWYYSTRPANADMHHAAQGVHDFLRAYYHQKSADWKANKPYPLKSWRAEELAKLPTYYVMELNKTMAETVAEEMPSAETIAANAWLPERELAFYSAEYARTGFQGGLQWYRCGTSGAFFGELEAFSGRTIDVPSAFIAGKQDWGTYQRPGVFEAMQKSACTRMLGCYLIDGAGHWVQQEQPEEVVRLLLGFLREAAGRGV